MPDDTLKLVPVEYRATMPPMGAMATVARMRAAHFIDPNIE